MHPVVRDGRLGAEDRGDMLVPLLVVNVVIVPRVDAVRYEAVQQLQAVSKCDARGSVERSSWHADLNDPVAHDSHLHGEGNVGVADLLNRNSAESIVVDAVGVAVGDFAPLRFASITPNEAGIGACDPEADDVHEGIRRPSNHAVADHAVVFGRRRRCRLRRYHQQRVVEAHERHHPLVDDTGRVIAGGPGACLDGHDQTTGCRNDVSAHRHVQNRVIPALHEGELGSRNDRDDRAIRILPDLSQEAVRDALRHAAGGDRASERCRHLLTGFRFAFGERSAPETLPGEFRRRAVSRSLYGRHSCGSISRHSKREEQRGDEADELNHLLYLPCKRTRFPSAKAAVVVQLQRPIRQRN